ncbi:DNA damage-regulated autophagy modulator protein 1-like [Ostrea edulis]|uniref:DNA damage-regulated autophagy modulator protein 1-like n=1 Tax=Ostrea edulis TaxID=37623 RepID=UPI0024AF69B7|nr:DNA damage-regulated autophagy modulator protein 1-like [Ostrea edulis]
MCCQGLSYLPLVTVVLAFSTFILTYVLAVLEGDVNPYFPYISDTGTKQPESCVFGQLINIASAIAFGTIFVRYKLVQSMIQPGELSISRRNKCALVVGALSSFGLSLVANFQETSVEIVHLIGAGSVLCFGVIYSFLQTSISYKMYPDYNGRRICAIRLVISVISLIGFITSFTSAAISRKQGHPENRMKWKPTDGGFAAHITSTISEWVTASTFLCFFFTYVKDFRKIKMGIVARVQVSHLDESYVTYDDLDENSQLIA